MLGSRFKGEIKKGAMPWHHQYIGNPVLTWIFNLNKANKSNISDTHSGFRAFTRESYDNYDREMDTLDMWFDEPPKEGYSREIEDGLIIKYDSEARVVGIEILFLSKQKMVVNAIPKEVKADFEKFISEFVNVVKAIA